MCVKLYRNYSTCGHVSSILTTCPTYHKEQASARGCFGSLFMRSTRRKKNCGRVVPDHMYVQGHCQDCSVRKDRLSAHGVGHGALRVHRQGGTEEEEGEESFRDERKRAAKASLEKGRKKLLKKERSNHEILHVQHSVWLDDLYYHPETLARKEAYARGAASAPPISSRPSKGESHAAYYSGRREVQDGRGVETGMADPERPRDTPQWTPSYGTSLPLRRPVPPAPTYRHPDHFPQHGPHLPPAVGFSSPLPFSPQRDNPSYMQTTPPANHQQPPIHPELRHKTGRVYNSNKIRNTPPPPLYQAHLEAMQTSAWIKTRPSPSSSPNPAWSGIRVEKLKLPPTRKNSLSSWIDRRDKREATPDDASDISFTCKTAQAVSNQPRSTDTKKYRSRK